MMRVQKTAATLFPVLWLAAASLLGTACGGGGDDIPEILGTEFLEATMNGGNEVPPVDTAASGSADFVVNHELNTIGFDFSTDGLQDIVAAHIHFGDPGVDGPIMFTLSTTSSDSANGILGSDDLTLLPDSGINSIDDAIQAMVDGHTYINVHTAAHPDGEIRGQIVER